MPDPPGHLTLDGVGQGSRRRDGSSVETHALADANSEAYNFPRPERTAGADKILCHKQQDLYILAALISAVGYVVSEERPSTIKVDCSRSDSFFAILAMLRGVIVLASEGQDQIDKACAICSGRSGYRALAFWVRFSCQETSDNGVE